jgi:hypothetical protein
MAGVGARGNGNGSVGVGYVGDDPLSPQPPSTMPPIYIVQPPPPPPPTTLSHASSVSTSNMSMGMPTSTTSPYPLPSSVPSEPALFGSRSQATPQTLWVHPAHRLTRHDADQPSPRTPLPPPVDYHLAPRPHVVASIASLSSSQPSSLVSSVAIGSSSTVSVSSSSTSTPSSENIVSSLGVRVLAPSSDPIDPLPRARYLDSTLADAAAGHYQWQPRPLPPSKKIKKSKQTKSVHQAQQTLPTRQQSAAQTTSSDVKSTTFSRASPSTIPTAPSSSSSLPREPTLSESAWTTGATTTKSDRSNGASIMIDSELGDRRVISDEHDDNESNDGDGDDNQSLHDRPSEAGTTVGGTTPLSSPYVTPATAARSLLTTTTIRPSAAESKRTATTATSTRTAGDDDDNDNDESSTSGGTTPSTTLQSMLDAASTAPGTLPRLSTIKGMDMNVVEKWLYDLAGKQIAELDELGTLQTGSMFPFLLIATFLLQSHVHIVETYRSPLDRIGIAR